MATKQLKGTTFSQVRLDGDDVETVKEIRSLLVEESETGAVSFADVVRWLLEWHRTNQAALIAKQRKRGDA